MKIFRSLAEIRDIEKTAVALGNFDGIHKGHQALINEAVRIAKEKRIKSAVFTFSNHPRNVMSGKNIVKNIIYEDEKIRILEESGVDYLFSIDFDESMMRQQPEDFVDDVLISAFNADTAVCGFNFTYGYRALGNAETLSNMAENRGFNVRVMDPVMEGGDVVSSTLIRKEIEAGRIEKAELLLGRKYCIRGEVIYGNQIGRTIGFPTCNIVIDDSMVAPSNGVYMTKCYVNGRCYDSITNVGNKPTIGTYNKNIETNILDFNEDIYGSMISVEFLKKVRDEKKFSGIEELREQIRRDSEYARAYHSAEKYKKHQMFPAS